MASTQRVLSGSHSKGSQAILVYPPSLSGTTAIDQYRQGINCRTMDHLYGFIGLKPQPINDPVKIVDGQRMETYRFYNDLDAPSNMAVSSSRSASGTSAGSFDAAIGTLNVDIFEANGSTHPGTAPAVLTATTTGNKWWVMRGQPLKAATAIIVFDGATVVGETIEITDHAGLVKAYVAAASEDLTSDPPKFLNTDEEGAAESLSDCIAHANGHNGSITVNYESVEIELTQAAVGTSGNTTIVNSLTNVTSSGFVGGSDTGDRFLSVTGSLGGVRANSLQDKVTVKYRVIRGDTSSGPEGAISGMTSAGGVPGADQDLHFQIRGDLSGQGGSWNTVRTHATADTSATAIVTFTGSTITGEAVTIVSTDETSRVYTFGAAQDLLAIPPVPTIGTAAASATSLAACIAAATGHNGKVTMADNSSGVLTLTQASTGPAGNTTIIETLASGSVVSFIGGGDYGLAAGTVLSVTESLSPYGPGPWSVKWVQVNHASGSNDLWALTDISLEVNSPIREPAWGVKSLPQLDTSTRSSGLGVAINHARDQRDLGQALYVYQDGSEYNDLMTTNAADIVRTPPLSLVVPEMMVDASARSLMDGVMEVFPIRGLADRSSIELPYTARGIRADMCTEDIFRQSTLMDQQYDPNETGMDMYFDGVETFGLDLLEPTFQAFNSQEDDETFEARLPPGATSTGPVTMQGLFAPRTNQLEPFKEGSDAYIRIAGITDEQTRTDIKATATVQFPSAVLGDDALANVSVADGDAASGMAEGQKVTIVSIKGTTTPRTRVYRIVDEELSTVTTGAVLEDGSDTGSATTADDGDIAVAIKATGSSLDTQNEFLVQLKAAIEHPKGHGSRLTVGAVPTQANGAQVLSLTQASGDSWTTVITSTVANFSVDMRIPANGGTVTIISRSGTSKAYYANTSAATEDLTTDPPKFYGATPIAAAVSLKACIETALGHNGKITVVNPSGTSLLTLTQADGGPEGNTTVTDNLTNAVATSFTGGESGGLADGIMTTALAAMTGSAQDRLKRNHVSAGAGFVYIGMDKGTDSIAFGGLKK
jgi:hypothetical protein